MGKRKRDQGPTWRQGKQSQKRKREAAEQHHDSKQRELVMRFLGVIGLIIVAIVIFG